MKTAVSLVVLLLTLGLVTTGCRKEQAATVTSTRSTTQPQDIPGVGNFAQVSPVLYRGAQPTAEGFKELKTRGIKTIVNLRSFNSDRDELEGTGLRYAHIYCKAWNPEDEDTIKFLKIMADPANHPVFVHCQHGADRTGTMVAVYRMIDQGWTADEAAAELANFGFHEVWTDLRDYLASLDTAAMRKKLESATAVEVELVQ